VKPFLRLLPLMFLAMGCTRTHLTVQSPDQQMVALVLSHASIDPPSQSLWLGPVNGSPRKLLRLSEDQDWCNTVVWSADSSTVAFLVQDARLLAFDRSGRLLLNRWLVDHRDYPPRELARDLSLSVDGSVATFRPCARRSPADCAAALTVALRGPTS
jgi:hypothetical protein